MMLSQLVAPEYNLPPEWDRCFNHIVTDSRVINEGDLFMLKQVDEAYRKTIVDDALSKKPAAILADAEEGFSMGQGGIPVFYLPSLSTHINAYLHRFYDCANQLRLVGVTGTNGKSSVTHYLAQLLDYSQQSCALMGTLGNGVYPKIRTTSNTTSDLATNLAVLNQAHEQGAQFAAIEVSSHGIEQNRLAGLDFEIALFTNLSQDHLDYHGSMDAYFDVKKRFINHPDMPVSIICIDDEYGQQLFEEASAQRAFSYGQNPKADICYEILKTDAQSMSIKVSSPWGEASAKLRLLGEFNAANAVASFACACALGMEFEQAINGLAYLQPVAGRMQVFRNPTQAESSVTAVIDFAHTPDALERALTALIIEDKKSNLVFGCGGNRDQTKRALMACVAKQHANKVWVTDDNPRDEDPEQIFNDVLSAVPGHDFYCEHNREQAIKQAIEATAAGEVLLIAGKGHENYQEVKGIKTPYSDYQVLESLGFSTVSSQQTGGAYVG